MSHCGDTLDVIQDIAIEWYESCQSLQDRIVVDVEVGCWATIDKLHSKGDLLWNCRRETPTASAMLIYETLMAFRCETSSMWLLERRKKRWVARLMETLWVASENSGKYTTNVFGSFVDDDATMCMLFFHSLQMFYSQIINWPNMCLCIGIGKLSFFSHSFWS